MSLASATIPLLLDCAETTIDFKGWAYAAAASTAQLKLTPSSGTAGTSGYHAGDSAWEFLEIEGYSVPSGITSLTVSCEIDAAATCYFDNVALFGPAINEYILPTGITHVSQVYVANDWEDYEYQAAYEQELSNWRVYMKDGLYYLWFDVPPVSKRKLRVVGYGYHTDLSSDTDTFDVDTNQGNIICTGAAALLLRSQAYGKGEQDRARLLSDSDRLMTEFEAKKPRNATNLPRPKIFRMEDIG